MRSWWHETTRQFFLYLLVGMGFVPFGLVYALLRVHHQTGLYVLLLPLAGGLVLAAVIRSVASSRLMKRSVSHTARHPNDIIAASGTLRAQ